MAMSPDEIMEKFAEAQDKRKKLEDEIASISAFGVGKMDADHMRRILKELGEAICTIRMLEHEPKIVQALASMRH